MKSVPAGLLPLDVRAQLGRTSGVVRLSVGWPDRGNPADRFSQTGRPIVSQATIVGRTTRESREEKLGNLVQAGEPLVGGRKLRDTSIMPRQWSLGSPAMPWA